jgi:hypothetical protein
MDRAIHRFLMGGAAVTPKRIVSGLITIGSYVEWYILPRRLNVRENPVRAALNRIGEGFRRHVCGQNEARTSQPSQL